MSKGLKINGAYDSTNLIGPSKTSKKGKKKLMSRSTTPTPCRKSFMAIFINAAPKLLAK